MWDGPVLDEVEDNVDKPESVVILAVLAVAGAAIAFALLPALVSLGLLAVRPEEMAAGFAGLAVAVGGVLGVVKLVALGWDTGRRHRLRRSNSSIVTSAD